MIAGIPLVNLLVWLVILGLIFYVLYWLVEQIPLPSPFGIVAKVILGLAIVIILLNVLLPMAGSPPPGLFLRH